MQALETSQRQATLHLLDYPVGCLVALFVTSLVISIPSSLAAGAGLNPFYMASYIGLAGLPLLALTMLQAWIVNRAAPEISFPARITIYAVSGSVITFILLFTALALAGKYLSWPFLFVYVIPLTIVYVTGAALAQIATLHPTARLSLLLTGGIGLLIGVGALILVYI